MPDIRPATARAYQEAQQLRHELALIVVALPLAPQSPTETRIKRSYQSLLATTADMLREMVELREELEHYDQEREQNERIKGEQLKRAQEDAKLATLRAKQRRYRDARGEREGR